MLWTEHKTVFVSDISNRHKVAQRMLQGNNVLKIYVLLEKLESHLRLNGGALE